MGRQSDTKAKVEFGDFQTPPELAAAVCSLLISRRMAPRAIVEPTCGVGSLFLAALDAFPNFERALGVEVNGEYVELLTRNLAASVRHRATVKRGNFFEEDWAARVASLPEPMLFIGNPPWVTSSDLGYLKSHNLPEKANFHGRPGIDAITGKSNFDISEWMLLKLLAALDGREAVLAMLCKTAVARKVLSFAWNTGYRMRAATTYRLDTAKHFGAAVDACLLICELGTGKSTSQCLTFESLSSKRPSGTFGHDDGLLLANIKLYAKRKSLAGECQYKWRSGIKHDCAGVMELRHLDGIYENGRGEVVELEPDLVYPMLKSSEVARVGGVQPSRLMLVTQRFVGEDTAHIKKSAPLTWRYLTKNREIFEKRASSIYKGKPPFSIFGVGDYTFSPWKVAISGLYKKLEFRVVEPYDGKPVVFDDTCYFVACQSEQEARFVLSLLSSDAATEFYSAFVFWDAKRPITIDLLRRLDLWRVAQELGRAREFQRLCARKHALPEQATSSQLTLGLQV